MQKIKVQLGKTINTGNYESLRIDLGIEMNIVNSENPIIKQDILYERLEKQLFKLLKKLKKRNKNYVKKTNS